MAGAFIHSVKVPSQYRSAAKLLKKTLETGVSIKGQIFEEKHAKTNRLYALIAKISKNKLKLDTLIERSCILQNEPRLDKYMCLVLMTELLFGPQKLNGESKPVLCVLGYEAKFREILNDLNKDDSKTDQLKDVVKPRYVRVNTNTLSRADAIELFVKDGWNQIVQEFTDYDKFLEVVRNLGDYDFVSDIHVRNLFVFPATSKRYWAKHELVYEKKVILQDKASCLPAILLDAPKGSIILDMCAAPGMKTTHLAAIIRNKGKIFASERDASRYNLLTEFVVDTKSTCVNPIQIDALTLEDMYVPNVEYILVDPSCSGSGMTNRLFFQNERDPDRLANLTGLQSRMLSHAMRAFTSAKKIVYSTCSIYHEENEKVVQECLEMCPDWELIKPIEFAEKWKHFGSPKYKHIGKKCIYAKSEIDLTDGFFVAIFERKSDSVKQVETYDRNKAVLERIEWNFRPKYPTATTTELAVKKSSVDNMHTEREEQSSVDSQRKLNSNDSTAANDITGTALLNIENRKLTDDKSVEKKKKKKLKTEESLDRNIEEGISTRENVLIDELDTKEKRKKKKRKHSDVGSVESEAVVIDLTDDVEVAKLKTKKKKHLDTDATEDLDSIKKSKKRKKDKHHDIGLVEPTLHTEVADNTTEVKTTKKKKSKKNKE